MPRCYMVKKGAPRHGGPPLCSPTEASIAPPCYIPAENAALTEPRSGAAEYAELVSRGACMGAGGERSAAETEAAHELLSLAQGLPPLPPAPVVTVLATPDPAPALLPIYTYTIQPANIYILAEEQPELYQSVHYTTADQQSINVFSALESDAIAAETTVITSETLTPPPESPSPSFSDDEKPKSIPTSVIQHAARDIETNAPPSPKAKYDCTECGKRYATSSNLSRHKQTHRSLDSMAAKRCGECGKAYVSMPALAMHVLTHRMGHKCRVCGKQFSRPWLLRGHLRSHTGEKPYRCASCGKAFADRSNLRAHLQTHSQDRKFPCPRCNKNFALKSYLNKHQESACTRD